MKRFFGRLLQTMGLLAILGLVAGAVTLYFAGQWLQKTDQPARADAIVCLSGDDQRLLHAADLFRQGYAPRVLVSRFRPMPEDERMEAVRQRLGYPVFADHEAYVRAYLGAMGVPAEAMEFYGRDVVSTVEEAEALRQYLGGEPAVLLVVTSPYHAFRAGMIFRDVLPDCTVLAVKNPHEHFVERWWTDQYSAIQVVLETAKLAHYFLGGAFRSTDPVPDPTP